MRTILDNLNTALHDAMQCDERVIILGEDILDPYGGAFKVTRGLSTKFPDRVMTTPISEAGIVGLATGLGLAGFLPIVEIMFGDFLTLVCDQVINHAAKFRWMYNDQVRVPIIIRTPMGGRRGYGPTHSQTLEKLFLGVPGLQVFAPCPIGNPGGLLNYAIFNCEDPVLFLENKLLYSLPLNKYLDSKEFIIREIDPQPDIDPADNQHSEISDQPLTYSMAVRNAPPPSITIAAYGHMVEYALQAIIDLAYEDEIFCELIIPTQLTPWRIDPIFTSAQETNRIIVIEEGTRNLGWGAEIIAQVSEQSGLNLKNIRRVAALDYPIPASQPLESAMLPGKNQIVEAAKSII
jgi:pyruvate/2-oxoglutarate/acetoin dehydrogenase E1 component